MVGKGNIRHPVLNSREILKKYRIERPVESFLEEITIYNERFNLVSRETSQEDLIRIAADCLAPFEFIASPSGRLFDIGPGAGFPSVILSLAFPNLEIVAIERNSKRAAFIRRVTRGLNLDISIVNEDFAAALKGFETRSFEFGAMKLVKLSLNLLDGALSLLKNGGSFIYYSSPERLAELSSGISVRSEYYYLDDTKHLRSLSYFSK